MNQLQVSATAPSEVAGIQRDIASSINGRVSAEGGVLTGLGPTFGLIGLEFMAALAEVAQRRTRTMTTLADQHSTTSTRSAVADGEYRAQDDSAATGLAADETRRV